MGGKMSGFVIPETTLPHLPITNSHQRFPLRRIFCVGRNYAAHTIEMGGQPKRDPPFFFTKQPCDLVSSGQEIAYPPATEDYQPEIELVLAIGQSGASSLRTEEQARHLIFGYAAGLDMTRRDIQKKLMAQNHPWDVAKNFAQSAVLGAINPASSIGHPTRGRIRLTVNGETRQLDDLGDLIWSVPEIILHLNALIPLQPGDLIFTGTPAGVAPVQPGDLLSGSITGIGGVTTRIAARKEEIA